MAEPFLFPPWLRPVFGDSVQYRDARPPERDANGQLVLGDARPSLSHPTAVGLDEDGWEIREGGGTSCSRDPSTTGPRASPQAESRQRQVAGFEDYLRELRRDGAVSSIRFERNAAGETEISFDMDADREGEMDERLRDLIRQGLVEDVSPDSDSESDESSDDY